MTTSLYLVTSADGLITTSNRVSNEESEWSDSAWECWCGHCTTSNNLIVGRNTYLELIEHDVSDILYPEHKIVISSKALDLAETWVQFSSPKQAINHLRDCNVENIIVGGGRQIGLAFVREGLIDEVVLDIQPTLFGNGIPLLGELDKCIQLELVRIETLEHGAIKVRYKLLRQ
jgi:dihydrofolate reductase